MATHPLPVIAPVLKSVPWVMVPVRLTAKVPLSVIAAPVGTEPVPPLLPSWNMLPLLIVIPVTLALVPVTAGVPVPLTVSVPEFVLLPDGITVSVART